MKTIIPIGCDHAGYDLKLKVIEILENKEIWISSGRIVCVKDNGDHKRIFNKSDLQTIPQVSLLNEMVPTNQYEYEIGQKIINQADEVVYIPTRGCMNLAATANVVLYDRLAKSQRGQALINEGVELIKASRDGNNHLRVKK